MKNKNTSSAFTLVEIIVSMTIFSIMMISVMSIFLFASQMSTRVEINRVMQENLKRVIEDIAENMRVNGLEGVRNFSENCTMPGESTPVISAIGLCVGGTKYMLGNKDNEGIFSVVSDIVSQCGNIEDVCYMLKKDNDGDYYPLSNSFIHFENISFIITNTDIPKLTIQITARPSFRKGLSSEIIENNYTYMQTTLSERLIETH